MDRLPIQTKVTHNEVPKTLVLNIKKTKTPTIGRAIRERTLGERALGERTLGGRPFRETDLFRTPRAQGPRSEERRAG